MTAPDPTPEELAFVERAKARLETEAAAHDARILDETFRGLRRPARWVPFAIGLAAALVASFATVIVMRNLGEAPAAFDGGAEARPDATALVHYDALGRVAEIGALAGDTYVGERLVFRAGRLIRSEHWRDGKLDGVVVDYDGSGHVVRIAIWVAGVASGPWLEITPEGRVKASGP
jgi:hypothetical protein